MEKTVSPERARRELNRRARDIPNYLDTLDGFRALATVMVLLFHYWQQSWVSFSWRLQLGSYTLNLSIEPWITSGSLGVEMLFILRGRILLRRDCHTAHVHQSI